VTNVHTDRMRVVFAGGHLRGILGQLSLWGEYVVQLQQFTQF